MPPSEKPNLVLVTDDSFAALVRAYKRSPKFLGYSDETKTTWGRELDRAAGIEFMGPWTVNEVRPSVVQSYMDALAGRPGKQEVALKALKQLEKWAIVRDLLPRPITLGVETEESEDDGHIPWTDEQVALAERILPEHLSRAITLGANTGQRGSDLVRMGPTDLETFDGIGGINVRQKKTKRQVWVPIISSLATVMERWERRPGPYLLRPDGAPWTRRQLSAAWAQERDTNPELASLRRCGPDGDKALVLHGLRGHACVRLLRAGANTRQIADMVGMSEEMVANYTRFSSQRENAAAAVFHMERTIKERSVGTAEKKGR